ncbi:preprotein translocase subunit SecG [Rhodoblastus acidophilus]|uniref:Protein-export membrane protein SecG n=1 Tax=Candidatus Rhodoblastus alkanivorans TaxID=2954117 RepID=A0ABS9Z9J5_9HYPH|nr:preprotein translocase subunit SecG [Candidatus Rhodoblastus alkanivorans]MCI4680006.1 preprotein translocase subunit SecG [Candidatus Rhodoblastus alkanivorans]MCI4684252.1 preprotein translocase subunit SecG [Candidatus Rhodoblastus alkanivorans]MDI4641572.1 preprotein translocase subunit SecG [Rhodoblastus acidophilus]
MQTVLIVVHLLIVLALIVVVLLQRSEGGALGMGGGGGGGGFFTGRGQANALTRATAILATLFFMTSLGLTILSTYSHHSQKSIFETTAPAPPSQQGGAAQPKGTVLEQLKQLEKKKAPPAAPAPAPVPAPPRQ